MLRACVRPVHRLQTTLSSAGLWLALLFIVVAVFYLSALQYGVNGSEHPYATDVGEIQNALPRWGTIHYPGYPTYSLLGSLFVNALRLAGIPPAAGSSLFSAVWGVLTVALLFALARELGAAPAWAFLGALVASLATSQWVDSSLAEIHTMGTALFLASLYFALRFGNYGRQRDLLVLALTVGLGLTHQRTMLFIVPSLILLIYHRWRELWHSLPVSLGVALLGPLTYLYLPIRAWQGAKWTFGAVGTWEGFMSIFLDTKVDRVVNLPGDLYGWLDRGRILAELLHDDLWLPILVLGLAGLWLLLWRREDWRKPAALTLAWLPALPLSLVIWEGRVSDALLAAKLPLLLLAGLGLAVIAQALHNLDWRAGLLAAAGLALIVIAEAHVHRPAVLAVTRDPAAERVIAAAEQVAQPHGGPPTTFVVLWGHSYWALAYAQAYCGQLVGLSLVDHNANLMEVARSQRLLTLSDTLYERPLAWWDELLGQAYLSSPAPGIVEISPTAAGEASVPRGNGLDLQNGIRILAADVQPAGDGQLILSLYWQAYAPVGADYSIAVHLLAQDPPQGQADILAQADRQHPVCGWYPTSRWTVGEVVRDTYELNVPPGSQPVAVRVGMYRQLPDGQFENTPWLILW